MSPQEDTIKEFQHDINLFHLRTERRNVFGETGADSDQSRAHRAGIPLDIG